MTGGGNMPENVFPNLIVFIGFLLLVGGVFFILAGVEIIKLQQVIVRPGKLTCIIGIVATIGGAVLLLRSRPASTEVVAPSSTPTEVTSPIKLSITPTAKAMLPLTGDTPSDVILCKDTENLAGIRVTCTISYAYCSYKPSTTGSPTFCNDAPFPDHSFTLVAWGEDWSDYDGKCIVINNGLVSIRDDKPQIEASSRSQVSICP
jgi:hypothetical protein